MAALVVAAAGVPVAKHGNRAASSACGSADVLEATGLPIDLAPDRAAHMLREANFTFMYAPRYHPGDEERRPDSQRAGRQDDLQRARPAHQSRAGERADRRRGARGAARADRRRCLRELGVRRGAVVHAENGIDEVAGDVPTTVYSFDAAGARRWALDPADYGIATPLAAIVGRFDRRGARRISFASWAASDRRRADVVALNAALALHTVGDASRRMDGALERARSILASGAALRTYERAKELAIDG